MTTRHLVDPEIAPLIDLFPRVDLESAPIADIRAKAEESYSFLPPPVIAPEEIRIASIHGGGMVMGSVRQIQAAPATLAEAAGVPVVSVDYRLAPEHPFPAPQQDCH
jgi:triacylglycerol lipase